MLFKKGLKMPEDDRINDMYTIEKHKKINAEPDNFF
jgi:hypothetical protein